MQVLFARVPRRMFPSFARLASRGPASLGAVLALAVASFAPDAAAAPKDAQADKAHSKAMDELYLESKFDEAASTLQKAIDACGESGCAPAKKAKLFIDLGTVQAGGQGKQDEAVASFVQALKLDKSAALDPDYVKKEIQKAYDDAKAKGGGGGEEPSGDAGGSLQHEPHPEQVINTPVPIHVVVPDKMKVGRVVVRYVPTGMTETREKELEKAGQAYRGNIPCDAVVEEGTLKYWIAAESKSGEEVASSGSESTPLTTEIKKAIEGKAPRWPGFAPPTSCSKGSGQQCVDDKDCGADQTCSSNECIAKGDTTAPPDEKKGELRRAWLSAWVAPNLAMVSGDNVCTGGGAEGHFVCQRDDGTKYGGTPLAGQANNVNFGFGVGPVALGLGFDYLVGTSVTVGGRLGFAIGGATADEASFMPIHVEARGAYYFTNNPFASTGVRPYVFLGAGAAQVDVPVDVQVVEDGDACGAENPEDFNSPCADDYPFASERVQTLQAYKQAGLGFAALGFGVAFAPADPIAIHVGLRGGITFPVLVPTVAPELAFAVGF
jgi:hypothetical protein